MYVKERKQVILCIKSNCRHVDVVQDNWLFNKLYGCVYVVERNRLLFLINSNHMYVYLVGDWSFFVQ